MHVLAIGTMTGKDIAPHLQAEGRRVKVLSEQGLIEAVFLKTDRSGPVLLLDGVSAQEAPQRLASLPFLQEGLVAFEYVELETLAERQQQDA